jgi:tetratricopeptide (TPR) repeat protein
MKKFHAFVIALMLITSSTLLSQYVLQVPTVSYPTLETALNVTSIDNTFDDDTLGYYSRDDETATRLSRRLKEIDRLTDLGMYDEAMEMFKYILANTDQELWVSVVFVQMKNLYIESKDVTVLEFMKNNEKFPWVSMRTYADLLIYIGAGGVDGYLDKAILVYYELIKNYPNESNHAYLKICHILYHYKHEIQNAREILVELEKCADTNNVAMTSVIMRLKAMLTFDIRGQIFQDGKALEGITVTLNGNGSTTICTTDNNGNYTFPKIIENYDYTISLQIGNNTYSNTFMLDEDKIVDFNIGNLVGISEVEEIPTTYSLSQNYPNPFNPTTTIQYSIPKDEYVKLVVYDVTGKVVKELVNGHKSAGRYNVEFNASGYSSGTYYYKLEAGDYKNIQKMMLIK